MDEFLKAWNEVQWPVTSAPEYRIYYDPVTGVILDYTNEIRKGTYIAVDRETFAKHRFDLKIKKGMLVKAAASFGKLKVLGQARVASSKQQQRADFLI